MASAIEPHLHLAVGHILFLDIVGYSKLLANEQKSWSKNSIRLFEKPSNSVKPKLRES